MGYKITITETRRVVRTAGKVWEKVGEKEVEREPRFFSQETPEPKTRIEPVYGYTPAIEKEVSETRDVLTQEVDELDLAAVIRAINGL